MNKLKIIEANMSLAMLCLGSFAGIVRADSVVARAIYGPTALAPALSPGYWKHNVNVYCGGHGSYSGDPHETAARARAPRDIVTMISSTNPTCST